MGTICIKDNEYENVVICSSSFFFDDTFQNKRILQRSKIFVDGKHYHASDESDNHKKKIRYIYNSKFI
tara:strand:+ start:285 stop:488 length:204 start_codon:yes stop_codon:yes gene_type:complete